MKKGFTLAEVLITLGIIGVVAALTLPGLIASYKKKALETRIKKFYSVLNQAYKMKIAQDEALDASMLTAVGDPDIMLDFFNKNYASFMKTIAVEKMDKGLAVGFLDGSGMYLLKDYAGGTSSQSTSDTYILFCVSYKNCKKLDETNFSSMRNIASDGKEVFTFYTSGNIPTVGWDGTREWLLERCQNVNRQSCTTLLWYDGWEVKDDYPW